MKTHLNVKETAAQTGLSPHTLNRWRCTGEGPPFVKIGKRRVAYPVTSLSEWLGARTRRSTSDQGATTQTNAQKSGDGHDG